MKRRIKNYLHITCDDVDLTAISDIEFYIKQGTLFLQYTPQVISSKEMLVAIPYEDAMKLTTGECRLQFAFTDPDGNPKASEITNGFVSELLKETGYDPV